VVWALKKVYFRGCGARDRGLLCRGGSEGPCLGEVPRHKKRRRYISPVPSSVSMDLACAILVSFGYWSSFRKGKKKRRMGHPVKWSLNILVNFIIKEFGPKSCFGIVSLLNLEVVYSNL
jgi:hypothetical protein